MRFVMYAQPYPHVPPAADDQVDEQAQHERDDGAHAGQASEVRGAEYSAEVALVALAGGSSRSSTRTDADHGLPA